MTTIRVGHLYPDYLNIYADRGNIAVFAQRAAWRGHELEATPLGMGDAIVPQSLRSGSSTAVSAQTRSRSSRRSSARSTGASS